MSKKKRTGELLAASKLSIDGEVRHAGSFISIRCGYNIVMLDKKQARALLTWLQQEVGGQ